MVRDSDQEFDGTDAARAVVHLVDGRSIDATVDSGGVDAGGSCSGGVDCEVR
jgi:hypothetical protein